MMNGGFPPIKFNKDTYFTSTKVKQFIKKKNKSKKNIHTLKNSLKEKNVIDKVRKKTKENTEDQEKKSDKIKRGSKTLDVSIILNTDGLDKFVVPDKAIKAIEEMEVIDEL